jgi:acyl dehydratase
MAQRKLTLAELKRFAGEDLGISEYMTIDQKRIQQFSETTQDPQWIHSDVERAGRESPYGCTIAHGFLTLSLISALTRQVIDVSGARLRINYGLDRVRFPAPVRAGSRIRARVVLHSVDDISGGLQAKLRVTVECEGSAKPACVAEWLIRYYT